VVWAVHRRARTATPRVLLLRTVWAWAVRRDMMGKVLFCRVYGIGTMAMAMDNRESTRCSEW